MESPGIRQWTVLTGKEPIVRIGVVLDEDAMPELTMRIPGGQYRLRSAEGSTTVLDPCDLKASLSENGLVRLSSQTDPSQRWTIVPIQPQPLARGEGVLVKDVVAGRGFHWHKRVDQTLSGSLEIHAGKSGLILVNVLPLEAYLAGVITAEMSGKCPVEFLKAQGIAARSWLLALTEAKHVGQPFDRCNDDCCQRYQGTDDLSDAAIDAVNTTRGLVLLSAGRKVVDANYSKSCGGIVETPEHIWKIHKPGLAQAVDAPAGSRAHEFLPVNDSNLNEFLHGEWIRTAEIYCSPQVIPEGSLGQYLGRVDESARYFRWQVSYSHDELLSLLKSKSHEFAEANSIVDLRVTQRGVSGRATEIAVQIRDGDGKSREIVVPDQYRIRQVLHASFLFSSAFEVTIDRAQSGEMKSLTLHGAGWGHGAGLCQIGALGMSLKGLDHRTIALHYFPRATLEKVYN
jgi:SpoIID/LytB domain protein